VNVIYVITFVFTDLYAVIMLMSSCYHANVIMLSH